MEGKPKDTATPRERILRAAAHLFYNEGIRITGVETIAKTAETTKMAIYRHWASKDELIVEWLKSETAKYIAILDDLETKYPDNARAQLEGLVRHATDKLYDVAYRGCPFANAISELPEREHPARVLIDAHKARQATRIAALCKRAGIPKPDLAAAELTFLMEGAQVVAQNGGVRDPQKVLATLAMAVVKRATAPVARRTR